MFDPVVVVVVVAEMRQVGHKPARVARRVGVVLVTGVGDPVKVLT